MGIFGDELKTVVTIVKVCVGLDMLAVAVLVPLLPSIFRELGISNENYGLVSSVYSAAQIVGGLILGVLSDSTLSRRTVLLISFIGSAISYLLVGLTNSLQVLIFSRVLVGLVKQTMTISTALITDFSSGQSRAKELGQLGGASSIAFIVGPSMGSLLYKQNPMYPSLLAAGLFVVNSTILVLFCPSSHTHKRPAHEEKKDHDKAIDKTKQSQQLGSFAKFKKNLKATCSIPTVYWLVIVRLIFGFLARGMSSAGSLGYFEERFGLATHQLGYVRSYQSVLGLVVSMFLVGPIVQRFSERGLITASIAGIVVANAYEGSPTLGLWQYLTLASPLKGVCFGLLRICLESLFTQALPASSVGAALSTLNVLQSAVGVLSPIYSGWLFGMVEAGRRPLCSGAHYAVFLALWRWAVLPRLPPPPSSPSVRGASKVTEEVAGGVEGGGGTAARAPAARVKSD